MNQSLYLKALLAALERIGAEVEEFGNPHRRERFAPDIETGTSLLGKDDLEPPHAHRHAIAVIAPVDETLRVAICPPCRPGTASG